MVLRRQTFAVAALAAAALACGVIAFRGMTIMGGLLPFLGAVVLAEKALPVGERVMRVVGFALVATGR